MKLPTPPSSADQSPPKQIYQVPDDDDMVDLVEQESAQKKRSVAKKSTATKAHTKEAMSGSRKCLVASVITDLFFNLYNTEIFVYKPWRPMCFFLL